MAYELMAYELNQPIDLLGRCN